MPFLMTKKILITQLDMNKLNNNYKNLEWCTSAENTQKYFDSIRVIKPVIEKEIIVILIK